MFSQTNAGAYKNVHLVKPCRVQRVCIGDGSFAPLDTCAETPVGPKRTIYADLAPLNICATHPAGPKWTNLTDLARTLHRDKDECYVLICSI